MQVRTPCHLKGVQMIPPCEEEQAGKIVPVLESAVCHLEVPVTGQIICSVYMVLKFTCNLCCYVLSMSYATLC